MKISKVFYILTICFSILHTNLFCQSLELLNTKDLVEISRQHGLDSALILLTDKFPIYHIDIPVTKELIKQIKDNKPSDEIENFIVGYSLCIKNANISNVLHEYLKRKLSEIESYTPDPYGCLPFISSDLLFALIENSSNQTDSLLLRYYELWNKKSLLYEKDYKKELAKNDWTSNSKLMRPYEDCNYNCYILQLFFKQNRPRLYNKAKLEDHRKRKPIPAEDDFVITKNVDCATYTKRDIYASIKLTKNYKSIGEIEFEKEPEFMEFLKLYNKSHCWRFLIYGSKRGYLDLGCQSEPDAGTGIYLRLELKENKLIIHPLYSWGS